MAGGGLGQDRVTGVVNLHVLVGLGAGVVKQLLAHWDGAAGLGATPGIERMVEIWK